MRLLLDSDHLARPHEVEVSHRPVRNVRVIHGEEDAFIAEAERACQIWGGAASPFVPGGADVRIRTLDRDRLEGAAVDSTGNSTELFEATAPPLPLIEDPWEYIGGELALGVLRFRDQQRYRTLSVPVLSEGDPWRGIYAATLGSLPAEIDPGLLRAGGWKSDTTFGDFFRVRRESVEGSWKDLIERIETRALHPRGLSMASLTYGLGTQQLPQRFGKLPLGHEMSSLAAQSILAVCSPSDVGDLALLWNLRGALGDFGHLPAGIPVAALTEDAVGHLLERVRARSNPMRASELVVTSASRSVEELRAVPTLQGSRVEVAALDDVLYFGRVAGLARTEVMMWEDGYATMLPVSHDQLDARLPGGRISRDTTLVTELRVADAPLPVPGSVRLDAWNTELYGGGLLRQSPRPGDRTVRVHMPSRLALARGIATHAGFDIEASTPGQAAAFALEGLGDLSFVRRSRHAPPLELMQSMAEAQGMSWQRARVREARGSGLSANVDERVGLSVDELPSRDFEAFRRTFGGATGRRRTGSDGRSRLSGRCSPARGVSYQSRSRVAWVASTALRSRRCRTWSTSSTRLGMRSQPASTWDDPQSM